MHATELLTLCHTEPWLLQLDIMLQHTKLEHYKLENQSRREKEQS